MQGRAVTVRQGNPVSQEREIALPSAATVQHVARLARLHLPENAVVAMQREFGAVLSLFDALANVSVDGIAPLLHPGEPVLTLQDDVLSSVTDADIEANKAALLQLAPETSGDYFLVPKVLEGA
jgi:aspartyl-tRNA(Asn)/glutamyl-tRNA(Gln) amidotransferase subunit C